MWQCLRAGQVPVLRTTPTEYFGNSVLRRVEAAVWDFARMQLSHASLAAARPFVLSRQSLLCPSNCGSPALPHAPTPAPALPHVAFVLPAARPYRHASRRPGILLRVRLARFRICRFLRRSPHLGRVSNSCDTALGFRVRSLLPRARVRPQILGVVSPEISSRKLALRVSNFALPPPIFSLSGACIFRALR